MSRSNPNKKKVRFAKRTIIILGEGPTENAFLNHLKMVFLARDAGISVTIHNANGGSPECIVEKVLRIRRRRQYDKYIVFLDSDIPLSDRYRSKAEKAGIDMIFSDPCIEGLFLNILKPSDFNTSLKTEKCKLVFHRDYLPEAKKVFKQNYQNLFPKELLESRAMDIESLRRIIAIFIPE